MSLIVLVYYVLPAIYKMLKKMQKIIIRVQKSLNVVFIIVHLPYPRLPNETRNSSARGSLPKKVPGVVLFVCV